MTRAGTARRRAIRLAASALLLVVLAGVWWVAAQRIEGALRSALGPRSEVAAVTLGWRGVTERGLRIRAAPGSGWPAADELRAAEVLVQTDLWSALRGVDLVTLQPDLTSVAEGGVKRGPPDLDLAPTVERQQLHAPGRLTLTSLELGAGGLADVPREAVLGFMADNDRIELDFTLEGRLDDPAFSINESLSIRVASAPAQRLGVNVDGVVEGVGGMIRGLFGH